MAATYRMMRRGGAVSVGVKAIAYVRASSEEPVDPRLEIDAQFATVHSAIADRGWTVEASVVDSEVSATVAPSKRAGLGRALVALDGGAADALVVARLDRVTRSVLVWEDIEERSRRHGWTLVAAADQLDLCTDVDQMRAAVDWYRRQFKASRAKDAIAAAKARGTRIGRPVEHSDEARQQILKAHARGASLRQIAAQLTGAGMSTPRGGRWHASTVRSIVNSASLDFEAEETRWTLATVGLEPEASGAFESPVADPVTAGASPDEPYGRDLSARLAALSAQVHALREEARLLHMQLPPEHQACLWHELSMALPVLMDVVPEERAPVDYSRYGAEVYPMVHTAQDLSVDESGYVVERVNGLVQLPSGPAEISVTRVHRLRNARNREAVEDAEVPAPSDQ